jgi:hypothetical protein
MSCYKSTPDAHPFHQDVRISFDIFVGCVNLMLSCIANHFLLRRIDMLMGDGALTNDSFAAVSHAGGLNPTAYSTLLEAGHRSNKRRAVLRDEKVWFCGVCVLVGLARSVMFFTLANVANDSEVYTVDTIQVAITAPIVAGYYSALLILWWIFVEPVCEQWAELARGRPLMELAVRFRVLLSVAVLVFAIGVLIAVDLLDMGYGCNVAEYGSSVIAFIGVLMFIGAALIAPRRLVIMGYHQYARITAGVCLSTAALVLLRALMISPYIQSRMNAVLVTLMMPVLSLIDIVPFIMAIVAMHIDP